MTTRARDFKFAGAIVQRLYLVMVALTKNRLSAQYGWFCHGRSHIIVYTCAHILISGAKRVSLPEAPQNVGENISEGASEEERRASEEGEPSSKRGEGWGREGKITLESPHGTSR